VPGSAQQQQQGQVDSQGLTLVDLLSMKVRLLIAQSECCLQCRQQEGLEAGHAAAMDALTLALSPEVKPRSNLPALAHRQVARCMVAEGMAAEGEAAYRQGVAGGDAVSVLELAALLQRQGRSGEASQLLQGHWEQQQQHHKRGGLLRSSMLAQTLLLMQQQELEQAKAVALAAMQRAAASKEATPFANQMIAAHITLQQASAAAPDAAAQGGPDTRKALLQEARKFAGWAIKSATALPGPSGRTGAGIAAAVLASIEMQRGAVNKAADALAMSLASWEGAVPGEVLLMAAMLTGEAAAARKAVHAAPWLGAAWQLVADLAQL
jgi:hypothetical protein